MIARWVKGDLFALGMTVGAGWISRIVTAVAQIISIRLLADMLGIDGYGAFAVIIGLLGWFALADFGFGSGLQNYISRHRVSGDDPMPAIISVAQVLALTTLALWLLYSLVAWWAGPWLLSDFGAVSHRDAALGWLAFAILATGTGAATIFLRICFAEHRGYIAHLISAIGAFAGLGGLATLHALSPDHLFIWSVVVFAAPNFLVPASAMLIFLLRDPRRSTGLHKFDRHVFSEIFASSRVFLVFNTMAASVLYVDYIIISQTISAREAALYAIVSRLFTFAFFMFNSVLQASWPVSAEIFHKGDFSKLRRTILTCILFGTFIILMFSTILYYSSDFIINILSPKDNIKIPPTLILLFAMYWIIRVWCDTFAMLVQSADGARSLLFVVPAQAILNLLVSIWAAQRYGLSGLLIGMISSFVMTVAWFNPALLRVLVNRKKRMFEIAAAQPVA